jgi:hypothetical protein
VCPRTRQPTRNARNRQQQPHQHPKHGVCP